MSVSQAELIDERILHGDRDVFIDGAEQLEEEEDYEGVGCTTLDRQRVAAVEVPAEDSAGDSTCIHRGQKRRVMHIHSMVSM